MPLTEEEAATHAISQLQALSEEQSHAQAQITRILHHEVASPFVDVHELLAFFDTLYFGAMLGPRVSLSWSPRLTLKGSRLPFWVKVRAPAWRPFPNSPGVGASASLVCCAGICELVKDSGGKYSRIRMKLSEPLLKFRPRSDAINTLLHEAIHAYFFITSSWRHSRDESGHGTGFQMLASAINAHGGYDVTIFHTFHDEVDSYRTHVWACDGPCRIRPPYFGLVKRSMNRAPGKRDSWWSQHQDDCGGSFTKIAEPELTKKRIESLSAKERAGRQKNKIDNWIKAAPSSIESTEKEISTGVSNDTISESSSSNQKRPRGAEDMDIVARKALLSCPICDFPVTEDDVNEHLDSAHGA